MEPDRPDYEKRVHIHVMIVCDHAKVLCSTLNDMNPDEVKRILNHTVSYGGEETTPLLCAVQHGHFRIVRLLVGRYHVDVGATGSVMIDDQLMTNVSPLWLAAAFGHVGILNFLIAAGADVNVQTSSGSTPLRAASHEGRLGIVESLLMAGADPEVANHYENTCLMIAAYRGHYFVVVRLIQAGADPNRKSLCGATALHFAAENGHASVIQELLIAGAVETKQNTGLTPLMMGAEQARHYVVELFFKLNGSSYSLQEKIDAFELLGASFANQPKNYNLALCYKYLHKAMLLRTQEGNIPKPPPILTQAYEFRKESQNLQELESIADDANALHMESLIIRERILNGMYTPETTSPIVFRGVQLAEDGQYERCILLWLHRMELLLSTKSCLSKDLQRFAQLFSRMSNLGFKIDIKYLIKVLEYGYEDLITKKNLQSEVKPSRHEIRNESVMAIVELLVIALLISDPTNKECRSQLNKRLYEILKLGEHSSLADGKTLLHIASSPLIVINDILLYEFGVKFPYEPLATLLIECGADVNAVDSLKNTPLHLAVTQFVQPGEFNSSLQLVTNLVNAGAHVDSVNLEGKEPFDMATSAYMKFIMQPMLIQVRPLTCLAAHAVDLAMLTVEERLELPGAVLNHLIMHNPVK
ncbi:Ankyrin repeat [Nesidiocoris tenuis]|uniref:Ankyrin repeat n=1 Tax=Nesidiocoris tenuis TaxID=355587 RepID=A0ABN7ACN7_9HEMI|nr:Ankyrin repeat [Nesidiocoris tenuis]